MVSRVILFISALLAMGSVWLFGLIAAVKTCCNFTLQGDALLMTSIVLFAVAAEIPNVDL